MKKIEVKNRDLKILYAISGNPSTYKDILGRTGVISKNFRGSIDRLRKQKKVLSVYMGITRSGMGTRYGAHKSVGDIAHSNIYFVPGDEQLLGYYITGYLPKEMPMGLRKSLSRRLKYLPKKTFNVIYSYLAEHTVR